MITKRESPVPVLIIFGVIEVITQIVIITRVTTDQDHIIQGQTPGHIIRVTIRGLILAEVILLEDQVVVVTVEATPLPEVLHQDRVEANLVHLVQPEKGIKFWNNQ